MAIQPNETLLDSQSTPRVTLAGKAWPVPKLGIAQNIVVGPIVARRMKQLATISGAASLDVLSEDMIQDLAMAAFQALRRGHGDLRRAEFDEMPIDIMELVTALPVIAQQTGLYRAAKAGESAPLAQTAATSPTGTP